MTEQEANDLLKRYKTNRCTKAETTLVEDWFMQYNEHEIDLSPELIEELGKQIYNELPGPVNSFKRFKLWPPLVAAVAILILTLGIWAYLIKVDVPVKLNYVNDVSPGSNKATLTLANGKTINLSDAKTGVVVGASSLKYNDGSEVALMPSNKGREQTFTASTPRGGTYQIELPDGTKVWLNAATTLTFGNSLNERGEGIRSVKLSGEAYFEVFEDKKRPFIVETVQQKIKVLGTHFNINAYQNLNNITTLTEGSVKIISGNNEQTLLLKPGQQSDYLGRKLQAKSVDIELYTAWKNGKLQFENADLKTVMEMVSRWYNVDVTYQNYPYESRFTGSISRSKNISEVLNILENTGEVHFKILGKEVIVMR